jgi:hypothetical protein
MIRWEENFIRVGREQQHDNLLRFMKECDNSLRLTLDSWESAKIAPERYPHGRLRADPYMNMNR